MQWRRTVAWILLLFLFGGGLTDAARFTVINKTDDDLYELYVTPHRKMTRSNDILHGKILRKNKQDVIFWSAGAIGSWDLRGVNGNGREYSWIDVDIKEIDKITLYNMKAKAESTKLKKMEQQAANSAEP
ncbi:hypothetical protein [uncultured Anaeromusa sp.]|uniref:hypothetical protein n=1 Tax=uncultured Anaeromusa sp. TaxID=673273 RepID=UPI0029C7D6DB|nr:hypothetical protein [uncultured Anaeromusa sp.]